MAEVSFRAPLWPWQARPDSWVFVTVPQEESDAIEDRVAALPPRGFGSVRVEVRIGGSTWRTSVFPSSEEGAYVLPVKRAVRRAEDLEVGDEAEIELTILDGWGGSQCRPPDPGSPDPVHRGAVATGAGASTRGSGHSTAEVGQRSTASRIR